MQGQVAGWLAMRNCREKGRRLCHVPLQKRSPAAARQGSHLVLQQQLALFGSEGRQEAAVDKLALCRPVTEERWVQIEAAIVGLYKAGRRGPLHRSETAEKRPMCRHAGKDNSGGGKKTMSFPIPVGPTYLLPLRCSPVFCAVCKGLRPADG